MPIRNAKARWEGGLPEGRGSLGLGSGAFEGQYSYGSRFEEGKGTNPEELIGVAHAGCFSMALAGVLTHKPRSIETATRVHLDKVEDAFSITTIELATEASVPDISGDEFQRHAEEAKRNCPVSKALAGVDIKLDARLAA
jgi:osmotically inducible protein OsmC